MPSAGGVASPGGVQGPGVQGPGGVPGLGGIADLGAGTDRLPLPALLSQVLVAFTIELDNEFERLMRHRTTSHGSTAGSRHAPWLTSMVMWSNCLRFVGEDGVTVGELQRLARTGTNLDGMRRWGYIIIEPDPADKGAAGCCCCCRTPTRPAPARWPICPIACAVPPCPAWRLARKTDISRIYT